MLINSVGENEASKALPSEDAEFVHSDYLKRSGKAKLKKIEILAQCFLFLLVGYETTASTLHLVLYMLALHPEYQDKCRKEVSELVGEEVFLLFQAHLKHF
jgi:cytochrome P450